MDSKWMAEGACRTEEPDIFFPGRKEADKVKKAKEICAGCPVSAQCLEWALYHNEREGIWGGVSARQRKAMRREAAANNDVVLICEECGTEYRGVFRSRLCSEACRAERRRETRRRYDDSRIGSVA